MKKGLIILGLIIIIAVIIIVVIVKNNKNNIALNNIETNQKEKTIESEDNNMIDKINIEINGRKLTATLENNVSSKEFVEKLKQNSITIDMHDYGNMEKVGNLGFSITRSDRQISAISGDIILYQGNQITIYYNNNNWNFTRLGHIDDISDSELESLLGDGNVSVTFSI